MTFIDPNFAACLIAGLGLLCYNLITDPNQTIVYNALNFFETTSITSAKFERLINGPSPCSNFKNVKLIYTLPAEEVAYAMHKLSVLGCFDDEEPFSKATEAALEAKDEETLITLFNRAVVQKHRDSIMAPFFFRCASSNFYRCVIFILNHNPLVDYEGKNIVHLAALLDDPVLIEAAPQDYCYLHLRDKEGNFPTKYVKSYEMFTKIMERSYFEFERLPYPREHQANIEYLRKSYQIGFSVSKSHRIELLFTDQSLFQVNTRLKLEVSRDKILKHSYKKLHTLLGIWYTPSFYGSSYVTFKNEPAVDIDGVTNDWLSSLIEVFFKSNPNGDASKFTAPLFQPVDGNPNIYQPTGSYAPSVYKFAGSIVAAALSRGITTLVEIVPSLYRVLLGIEPFRLDDLKIQDPTVYKNLISLRDSFINNVPVIGFNFATLAEVDNYIINYAASRLYTNHSEFLDAFAEGFSSKLPHKLSKYLDLADLKSVLRGRVTISTQDFKDNIIFHSSITTPLRIDDIFFEMIDKLSQKERFKLVRFVTGRHGLPYGGLSDLSEKINVYFNKLPLGHLPQSNTCFSDLYLPKFTTGEELKGLVFKAMDYCNTFDEK